MVREALTLNHVVMEANVVRVATMVMLMWIASTLPDLISSLGVVAGNPDWRMVTDGTLLEIPLERRAPVVGRHHQ